MKTFYASALAAIWFGGAAFAAPAAGSEGASLGESPGSYVGRIGI